MTDSSPFPGVGGGAGLCAEGGGGGGERGASQASVVSPGAVPGTPAQLPCVPQDTGAPASSVHTACAGDSRTGSARARASSGAEPSLDGETPCPPPRPRPAPRPVGTGDREPRAPSTLCSFWTLLCTVGRVPTPAFYSYPSRNVPTFTVFESCWHKVPRDGLLGF